MNSVLRSLYLSRISGIILDARAASGISHAGVKGRVREILIGGLFRPLLPSDIGIGTGQIVSNANEISPQQDVIIFDRGILPPITYDATIGLFPVESVLATIEVKSTLTREKLRSAFESAKTIHGYSYITGNVQRLISVIFALNSDLKEGGKTEIKRYLELHKRGDTPIRAICVAGRGYWYFNKHWFFIPPDGENNEIISFVAGLADTFKYVRLSRQHPDFQNYLIEKANIKRVST